MKQRLYLVLSIGLVFMLSQCGTGDLLGNFNLISPEEELRLGNQLAAEITKEKQVVQDEKVKSYIDSIGERLVTVSRKPDYPYNFYVLKEDSVNAFAIPGGHLFVLTGLIEAAEHESEVAAVVAHELAHAEERHPTERLSRAQGTQMIASILLGRNPGALQSLVTNVLATSGISAYSRSAEMQADEIGVYLLNRAGYDPYAMVTFFEKLVALEKQHGGGGESATLFASHPPTQDRIEAVKQIIQSFGDERATKESLVGQFNSLQTTVREIQ